MKNIYLNSLTLTNFKGEKSRTIQFGLKNEISGENEAGKTTIMNAYLWLLTGKDFQNRKDFEIKNNVHILLNQQDHEVIGEFIVEGETITLKRIYREKWVKQRGEEFATYTGNETIFFYNDVPCSQTEFQLKVNSIIPEDVFKVLTNPFYFNEILTWQQRRAILTDIAGDINESDISENKDFKDLNTFLSSSKKTVEEYKREIQEKKKTIQDELKQIPARIDEVHRGTPTAEDWPVITSELAEKENLLSEIESQLLDISKANQSEIDNIQKLQNEKHSLQSKLNYLLYEHDEAQKEIPRKLQGVVNDFKNSISVKGKESIIKIGDVKIKNDLISELEKTNESLRENVKAAREIQFVPSDQICPTCKRKLDNAADKIAELEANFNIEKAKGIAKIQAQGKANNEKIEELKAEIEGLEKDAEVIKQELELLDKGLIKARKDLEDYKPENNEFSQEIKDLKAQILAFIIPSTPESSDLSVNLRRNKPLLIEEINSLKTTLSKKEKIDKAAKRIAELESDRSRFAQEIASLEKIEFNIEAFTKAKVDMIESKVNGMFGNVRFKMFEKQVNGGLNEICTCTYKGVNYGTLNDAGTILAGLEIISALSKYYQISAPIWIDRAESINEIPEMEAQVISLKVTEMGSELTIKDQ